MAAPTTTPSATSVTSRAWSGVDTPTPMSTGLSVASFSLLAMTAAAEDSDWRSPVTPRRPTP